MVKKQLQNSLYQKRGKIKQDVRPIRLNSVQWGYIRTFAKKNSGILKTSLILLFALTFVEILIPLITNFYVKKYSSLLEIDKLIWSLAGLIGLLAIYLTFSFFSIKYEKTFLVKFMNYLRKMWFSKYLNKGVLSLKGEDKGRILTKISFHFSLLQMGLTNSVFSSFAWLFMAFGLIISSFFLNTTLLVIVLVSIPTSLLVGFVGYIISKYYVSQDQTLYSRILMYINESLEDFLVIKTRQKEDQVLRHFDKLVDIDSFFRIKRDLWLKYASKIVFVLISLFAGGVYLFEIYYPFLKVESSAEYIVYGIFFALIIKLFYLTLRIGLFSFPVKLGAAICIPDEKFFGLKKTVNTGKIKSLVFKSSKVRLGRGKDYTKNLEFNFSKGGRYLIHAEEGCGKTTLGHLFSGQESITRGKPWVVKLNGNRLLYTNWPKLASKVFFVSDEFTSEKTLIETFSNGDEQAVKEDDFKKIITIINSHKHFGFLMDHGRSIGRNICRNSYSGVEKALLQMAYAMIRKPDVIVIDNLWLDINDPRINETIIHMDKVLQDSIIINLSSRDNDLIKYDQKHSL